MKQKEVVIQVDGSCVNNVARGLQVRAGYAFVVLDTNRKELGHYAQKLAPMYYPATETRCEMMAIIAALTWLKKNPNVSASIESDSKSTVDGILGKAKRKQNKDLWEKLEKAILESQEQIQGFYYVKRELNARADSYARETAQALFISQEHQDSAICC